MAEWVKAAEVQLEMHRFLTSEPGKKYMRGWVDASCDEDEGRKRSMYQSLILVEAQKLLTADAIWVAPEMCQLVQAARDGFQPEAVEADDFIVPNGFLYFSEPIYMLDRHRMQTSVGAISWCPIEIRSDRTTEEGRWGMAITLYSSVKAREDSFSEMHQEMMRGSGFAELVPLHLSVIEFGDPFGEGELEDEHGRYTGADQWWKTVQVSLRMMQQRIAVRSDERLPRPTRRRMERSGSQMPEDVLVIRLRRPASRHTHDEEHEPGPLDAPLDRGGLLAQPVVSVPRTAPPDLHQRLREGAR